MSNMSSLTAEQKMKIEENKRKALALRAAKMQTAAQTNTPRSGNAVPGPASPAGSKQSHQTSNITNRYNPPGARVNVPHNSPKQNFSSKPTTFGQRSDQHSFSVSGVKPKTSTAREFYSVSAAAQRKSLCDKNNLSAKSFQPVTPKTKTSKSHAKCVLISRDRFMVEVGYCAPLIEVFKTIPSKQYEMQTKKWSFALSDYNTLWQTVQQMREIVSMEPLPFCVRTVFSRALQNLPQDRSIPVADLSSVDERLVSKLLPFQREGINFTIARSGRVLIADDMGLGKTIQSICVMAYYRKEWPVLIVVPSSVRFAWREQILQFMPSMDPQQINVVVTGKDNCTSGQINILSYDLMVRRQKELVAKGFKVVVMDESHFLKNSKTARTIAAAPLLKVKRATRVLLLSGTPALSRPSELFAQLSAIEQRLFPSFHEFGVRYCAAKQMPWGWDYTGSSHLEELQLVLEERLMIRRMKKDVLTQLPSKVRQMVVLDPSTVKVNKDMKNSHKYVDKAKGSDRRGALLEYFHETAEAKTPAVKQYVLDLLESDNKFLLFAHHQTVLDNLEEAVVKKKFGYIRIDGRTSAEQRNFFCNKFQNSDEVKVALLSITAANAGLNLTAATLVVFAELFWNPGILVQAEDRAHRIGQQDSVSVRYLVASGTADDFVWPLVKTKLEVLSKAGLSKEDFEEANTTHVKDPRQKDIMSYFEESFFEVDWSEEMPETTTTSEATSNNHGNKGSLFQYFKADNSTGSTASHPREEIQDGDLPENADWLDEKFGDEDPDEPVPKKPRCFEIV